jgi:HB1, ASXL, restriction endonuclease HTH domain
MTFLEAAVEVLRAAHGPLSSQEITERAIKRGLVRPTGKTPQATMSAALYGAQAGEPIRREFRPGRERAVRGTVRWVYVAKRR